MSRPSECLASNKNKMNDIILPILIPAAVVGLFAPRITIGTWCALCAWISLVTSYYFFKH